jgi:hypothetical protein
LIPSLRRQGFGREADEYEQALGEIDQITSPKKAAATPPADPERVWDGTIDQSRVVRLAGDVVIAAYEVAESVAFSEARRTKQVALATGLYAPFPDQPRNTVAVYRWESGAESGNWTISQAKAVADGTKYAVANNLKAPAEPTGKPEKLAADALLGQTRAAAARAAKKAEPVSKAKPRAKPSKSAPAAPPTADEVSTFYGRAIVTSEEDVVAMTARLGAMKKADLVKAAEQMGLVGMKARTKDQLARLIIDRVRERKDAYSRASQIEPSRLAPSQRPPQERIVHQPRERVAIPVADEPFKPKAKVKIPAPEPGTRAANVVDFYGRSSRSNEAEINAVAASLKGAKKDELVLIAKNMGMVGAEKKSGKAIADDIRQRMVDRLGATQKAGLIQRAEPVDKPKRLRRT